jgi:hypothetical protein
VKDEENYIGSDFDDFLAEEWLLEEVEALCFFFFLFVIGRGTYPLPRFPVPTTLIIAGGPGL